MKTNLMVLLLIGASASAADDGWQREMFKPGGEKAELHYVIYGRFAALPKSAVLEKEAFCHALLTLPGAEKTASVGRSAPSCAGVRVSVADPPSLSYLRDTLRAVTTVVGAGGVLVYDVKSTFWRDAAEWRKTFAEPLRFDFTEHVDFVVRPERDSKGLWLRTRGMGKFGRPEVTMHHAPQDDQAWAGVMLQIAASMADGMRYPEEAQINANGGAKKSFVVRLQREPEFDDVRLFISKD